MSKFIVNIEEKLPYYETSYFDSHYIVFHRDVLNIWGACRQGRVYEPALISLLYSSILRYFRNKEKIALIDVGANTGTFCFMPTIDSRIECVAFEPVKAVFDVLEKNIEINNSRTSALNLAISNFNGTTEISVPESLLDSGLCTLGPNLTRFSSSKKETVEVRTLDSFDFNVDVLKIDTEGCELYVLEGARETIKKHRPIILSEFLELNTRQFGYRVEKISEFLMNLGYNLQIVGTGGDILAIPKELQGWR